MSNYSFRRKGKILIFLSLLILVILITLSLTIFISKQHPPATKTMSYAANIVFEPQGYGIYDAGILSNPNIAGVDINLNWVDVEPQRGVFNWTPVDREIAAWATHGKKFTFIIRYIKESGLVKGKDCNQEQYLPSWEIARVPHFCDTSRRILIPDYFDPTFMADLQAFVGASARHFATSPYRNDLAYIRVGVGLAGEGFPLMPCNNGCNQSDYVAARSRIVAFGYTPLAWKEWQETMMANFKSVFSYTTVIYPINQLDVDETTGQPVQMEVAYWAAAHGIGIGQQGLVPDYPSNYAQVKTILSFIQSHYPNTYIQFQTVASVGDISELQGDIATAEQYGAKSIEWYANDATNPTYQSSFQRWQQTVDNKFGNK